MFKTNFTCWVNGRVSFWEQSFGKDKEAMKANCHELREAHQGEKQFIMYEIVDKQEVLIEKHKSK